MGVADYGVGDVAHEGPLHAAEPAAAYYYHAGADVFGQVDYCLVAAFVHLEVGDRYLASRGLDLPYLLVQHLPGLAFQIFVLLLHVSLVDGRRERPPNRDDVEPRARTLREVCRHRRRQIRLLGTIRGKKYMRGKDTQAIVPS